MKSFEKDGVIDWQAYRRARVENGEICRSCDGLASIINPPGHPTLCHQCASIDKDGELRHESRVRCPKCRRTWNPGNGDDYDFYKDGEHDATCGECGHDFEITTHVSYTFTSPPMIPIEEATKKDEKRDG